MIRAPMTLLTAALLSAALVVPVIAKPAMWVVRDGDTEVTLYGTIHFMVAGVDWMSPAVAARLAAADALVVEGPSAEDPAVVAEAAEALALLPQPKPLAERLSSGKFAAMQAWAGEYGLSLEPFDRMDSWAAALNLMQLCLASIGSSGDWGVDTEIVARAREANKPIIKLETVREQIGVMDSLPEADQVKMFEGMIDDCGNISAKNAQLLDLWMAGDPDEIERVNAVEIKGQERLQQAMTFDRNRRFADWIAAAMQKPGKPFVAIGVGHYGGEQGVLALLKAKGLTVERLE
jgi:uncharacterized protein YbaP (TraB family)